MERGGGMRKELAMLPVSPHSSPGLVPLILPKPNQSGEWGGSPTLPTHSTLPTLTTMGSRAGSPPPHPPPFNGQMRLPK